MAQAIAMMHTTDAKKVIRDAIGDRADNLTLVSSEILVGVYVRGGMTAGGLHLPETMTSEDKFQGKVGLVLQVGPIAFQADDHHKWGEKTPQVGDWVLFNIGDTFAFELGKHRCRIVEDVHVKAIVAKPDMVW